MANLKDIKKRIGSVKSTQKITKAMKLVAASKFARANSAARSSRPYSEAFDSMVSQLLAAGGDELSSTLLEKKSANKSLIIFMSTDKGLCGGINANLYKKVVAWAKDKSSESFDVVTWGRKATAYCKKHEWNVIDSKEGVLKDTSYAAAKSLSAELLAKFESDKYSEIFIIYPEFQSAISNVPTVKKILPIDISENQKEVTSGRDYVTEPSIDEMLDNILKRKMNTSVHRILLDTAASEHGSRMSAMESATKNAGEVVRKLTLEYNRARQAAITKELIEIVSGAQALD